jgi:lysophospholipase L1-like esterase
MDSAQALGAAKRLFSLAPQVTLMPQVARLAVGIPCLMLLGACLNLGTASDSSTTEPASTALTPLTTPGANPPATPVSPGLIPDTSGGLPPNGNPAPVITQPVINPVVGGVVVSPNQVIPPPAGVCDGSRPEPVGLARYTLIGRFDTGNPSALVMSFAGSKIGATFTGTSLSVVLSDTGTDGFNIVIDGGNPIVLYAKPNTANVTYLITDKLADGPHTVWMTKRTEFSQQRGGVYAGRVTFMGFKLDPMGRFCAPPVAKTRRIEAIGDSSFAGYAVEQLYRPGTPGCDYSVLTQNADKAVPAYAAAKLAAEYTNLSFTGEGIYHSAWDPGQPSHYLPAIWNEVVAPLAQPAYNFGVAADVVLISAGGNDLDGPSGSGTLPDPAAFINTYAQWMVSIRARYPNAFIVAILSPNATGTDKPTLTSAISQAVSQAQAAKAGGDPNIAFYNYFTGDPRGWAGYGDASNALGLGYACQYHPSAAGSQFLGERLAEMVAKHMGW